MGPLSIWKYREGTIRCERRFDETGRVIWWAFYALDAAGATIGSFRLQRAAKDAIDRHYGRETKSAQYRAMQACAAELGEDNDCTVKALAAVTRRDYREAHEALRRRGRREGHGCYDHQWLGALRDLGCTASVHHDRRIKTVKSAERYLPMGRFLVHTRGHVLAVTGGEVHDWTRGSCTKVLTVWRVE